LTLTAATRAPILRALSKTLEESLNYESAQLITRREKAP
jgi:hypothetical protein